LDSSFSVSISSRGGIFLLSIAFSPFNAHQACFEHTDLFLLKKLGGLRGNCGDKIAENSLSRLKSAGNMRRKIGGF
jgi:hypothetical protein